MAEFDMNPLNTEGGILFDNLLKDHAHSLMLGSFLGSVIIGGVVSVFGLKSDYEIDLPLMPTHLTQKMNVLKDNDFLGVLSRNVEWTKDHCTLVNKSMQSTAQDVKSTGVYQCSSDNDAFNAISKHWNHKMVISTSKPKNTNHYIQSQNQWTKVNSKALQYVISHNVLPKDSQWEEESALLKKQSCLISQYTEHPKYAYTDNDPLHKGESILTEKSVDFTISCEVELEGKKQIKDYSFTHIPVFNYKM